MRKVYSYQLHTLPNESLVQVSNRAMGIEYVCTGEEAYTKVPEYVSYPNGKGAYTDYTLLENVQKLSRDQVREVSDEAWVLVVEADIYNGLSRFISDKGAYYHKESDTLLCAAMYSFE